MEWRDGMGWDEMAGLIWSGFVSPPSGLSAALVCQLGKAGRERGGEGKETKERTNDQDMDQGQGLWCIRMALFAARQCKKARQRGDRAAGKKKKTDCHLESRFGKAPVSFTSFGEFGSMRREDFYNQTGPESRLGLCVPKQY